MLVKSLSDRIAAMHVLGMSFNLRSKKIFLFFNFEMNLRPFFE